MLGAVFGLLFSLLQRNKPATVGRSLILSLAMGATIWMIFPIVFGALIFHARFDLGIFGFFQALVLLLVYGALLGTI